MCSPARVGFLAFLLCAALTSPVRAGEPETLRFGVCLPLSGEFSMLGRAYLAGIRIKLDDYNARPDREFSLESIVLDDESDDRIAVRNVRRLADAGVSAVIGSVTSSATLAMLEVARPLGLPVITPSATSPKIGVNGDTGFRLLFDDDFQGEALAKFMRDNLRLNRVAIIMNKRFEYSRSITRSFLREWTSITGEISADLVYDTDLREAEFFDFTGILERVKASGAQLVLLPGYPEEVASIIRQSLGVDFHPVFCGGDAWQHETLLLSAGRNLDGSYHIGAMDEEAGTPAMREFMSLLDRSNELQAEPASALGYDALALVVEAARNGRERGQIVEGLYKIRNFPLASGAITIDRKKGSLKSAYIVKVENGPNGFHRHVAAVVDP